MNQSIDIDEEKLDRMKYKILQAENDNNKTKEYITIFNFILSFLCKYFNKYF